ncbi:protein Atossa [Culicoides brevitarsis]|uniref:protein Atossa n=1 Tax=Culicoides brevitarsis TaxID=469753 RepID=UPI00307C18AD
MHSSGLYKDPAFSVSVGIAALILEGRPNYNVSNDVFLSYDEHFEHRASENSATVPQAATTTQRISQKLQQIRNYPSTSKDYVENTVEISVGSPVGSNHSDEFAERIYVNRKLFRGNEYPRAASKSAASRSLFKSHIDTSWTETSVVYNGLEQIKMLHNISPLKITAMPKSHANTKKKPSGVSVAAQGPHCEQFLKKIGLVKNECITDEIDHKCEYFNNICRAWQSNLTKITSILSTNECVCIEVYLGPETQMILLEEWIIKTIEKSSRPVMSLQSLCSAIRSQLYFSQIVAWTEQLNNLTSPLPFDVINNPRIVKDDHGASAKLDIVFRIRAFDGASNFSEKPQVHQFPDANLTESTSIQVCLKSLPRRSVIPTVVGAVKCENSEAPVTEKKLHICTEKGKHCCRDEIDSPTSKEDEKKFPVNNFPIPSSEHREKQLQKYRKRIMKREKVKKKTDSNSCGSKSDDSSDNQTLKQVATMSSQTITTQANNKTTQTTAPNANTVGTQTDYCDMMMMMMTGYEQFCNNLNNKRPMCLHCDNEQNGESMPFVHNNEADPLEKADILLQALERTASVNSKRPKDNIYMNVHEIFKRQKCCQNKKSESSSSEDSSSLSSYITEQEQPATNLLTENNNKITLPSEVAAAASSSATRHSSSYSFLSEPDCDTCLSYETNGRAAAAASPKSPELFVLEGRSNPQQISHQRSSTENVFHFDDASSPCSSSNNSLSIPPVQKSSSAPTFYCAATSATSLSPRFCRLAAIYNRRSRHLSDRSSTSEEQFSDDDTFIKSSGTSSLSKFSRGKDLGLFKRNTLLGSLEESLLHYRIPIKHQVVGFKVLLGASGSFCPTQLTVPAVSSFYELDGHSVLTPYVSEFKLPRKGYCVPRQGTIQVTLLNPLGTVVRMFVVPYDYSDMPPTNVSFIRQRIMARRVDSPSDSNSGTTNAHEFEKLSRNEQMRLLRYAIHLRFKTSRSGRLYLHTDVKILVLRRPDCDTAAAHANNSILESPNELNILTIVPEPKYSQRFDK